MRFFFLRHGEVILFAVSLFLFAVRFFFLLQGFHFCHEVNAFAMTVVGHRTKAWFNHRILHAPNHILILVDSN